MDLRQLRYFVAVARAGSFMAASRVLHVSQPALGYQIKQLEATLEVDLLRRHSRGVALTPAGATLLAHAEDLLERLRGAEAAILPFRKKLAGELSLGVTPTSGRVLAPDLLAACAERTGLKIAIHQGMSTDLFGRVEAGTLDMALCYEAHGSKAVRTIPLYRERLYLIGPPDVVTSNAPIAFDELRRFSLVLDDRFQVIRRRVEAVARERRVKLDVALEIEPINLKREMMVRHRRCTVVPYGLFLDEIRAGQLNARKIRSPALTQSMHLAFRRNLNDVLSGFMLSVIEEAVASKIVEGSLGWEVEPRSAGRQRHDARRVERARAGRSFKRAPSLLR
jgi:LysR family nitrogen assimilation transcriptional regulator